MSINPYEAPRSDSFDAPSDGVTGANDGKPSGAARRRRRLTPMFWVGLANVMAWHVGIAMDLAQGLSALGSVVCVATYNLGFLLVPISIVAAFLHCLVTRGARWDVYGPGVAIGAAALMYFVMEPSAL